MKSTTRKVAARQSAWYGARMKMSKRAAKIRAAKIAKTMWENLVWNGTVTSEFTPRQMTIKNVLVAYRLACQEHYRGKVQVVKIS